VLVITLTDMLMIVATEVVLYKQYTLVVISTSNADCNFLHLATIVVFVSSHNRQALARMLPQTFSRNQSRG
jgi:hypothetical protein